MGVCVDLKERLNVTLVLLASLPSGKTDTSMLTDSGWVLDDSCWCRGN